MQHVDSDNCSSDYETIFQDDFTNIDSSSDTEEILNSDSDEENKLLYLTKMGYSEVEASIAMERCGLDSSITELTGFICAAQMAKAANALLPVEHRKSLCNDPNYKKRRNSGYDFWKWKKQRKLEKKLLNDDDHAVHLSNPMIGFWVPTEPDQITQRTLLEDAIGPPYFYYENVALAPVFVWTEMSRVKLTEMICKALEAYDDEPLLKLMTMSHLRVSESMFLMSAKNGICCTEAAFYCLVIPLKTDAQELNVTASSAASRYPPTYPTLPEP
ncbi:shaggy-related protein kinase epsilon [Hibiscus syriacus]|uniref:Shaggy-related protein kinase epsilon n=1 Tax=Hibiscus syriacus TaxID=106335 RepID=A0A6A3CW05_HIBSY|nr:shaggy-related protein kinase epsilon [Hibiscus syriacus]